MKVIKTEHAGIQVDCDISKLSEQDYQDINELYLDNLLVTFVNQPFETLPFAKLIHKMGTLPIGIKCCGNKVAKSLRNVAS